MAYFDSSKSTKLYLDASPFGLGAILTQTTPGQQDTKVIAYASRSLTDTESRYSQIGNSISGNSIRDRTFPHLLVRPRIYTDHRPQAVRANLLKPKVTTLGKTRKMVPTVTRSYLSSKVSTRTSQSFGLFV